MKMATTLSSRTTSSYLYYSFIFTLCVSLLPIITMSISFNFPSFEPNSNILFQGDAVNSVGAIEFNKVNYLARVGLITYADKMHLWDRSSGMVSDFSTHFSFFIDTLNQTFPRYGHGLSFFITSIGFEIPPNSNGGFLGLLNTTTAFSSDNQIIFVEFDSFSNEEWDPSFEHVGINNNTIASTKYARWNATEHSGNVANVWVTYNATTKNLSVVWSYGNQTNNSDENSLSLQIDLMEVLPEWVCIGFSAATGQYIERHNLQSWEFSSNLEGKVTNHGTNKVKIIVGLTTPFGFLLVGGLIVFYIYHKRRLMKANQARATSFNDEFDRGVGPRRFSYSELALATYNFSSERKLGEGGFGSVYKGYLMDLDMQIAVKKISRESKQGEKEYTTEVKIISRLRHRNLVQLIGWCHEQGQFLLVYEYMPNGSLDSHLFGKKGPLSWPLRFKIALGLASGLNYLHDEWEQCVVHRDIKSSNIMLDSNFNVKLGDFGLARLMDHELGAQTTGLAGTLGYMAPEYITTRKASKESDVYSFGVVVLEIITGNKARDPVGIDQGLIEWVWELYGKGELLLCIDQRLGDSYDAKQAECLVMVGLWCAHPDHSMRPSIRQVIQLLNFEATLPNLPPKMPIAVYHVPVHSASSSAPSITSSSIEVGR